MSSDTGVKASCSNFHIFRSKTTSDEPVLPVSIVPSFLTIYKRDFQTRNIINPNCFLNIYLKCIIYIYEMAPSNEPQKLA